MHFQADRHMKVILLHWFDNSVKLGVGGLPMTGSEWPEPKYSRREIGEDDGLGAGMGVQGGIRSKDAMVMVRNLGRFEVLMYSLWGIVMGRRI
jgi:hypothetical protein